MKSFSCAGSEDPLRGEWKKENGVGNLLVCTGEEAEIPFYLNTMGVNVYSVEELCYMLAQNPFLITGELMDKPLLDWLSKDCALPELSGELTQILARGSQLSEFVGTLLSYVGYCTEEERQSVDEMLLRNANLNEYERRLTQGDYLLENGRLEGAVREYELLAGELPAADQELRGKLFHRMGYAYASLLQFDVAAKYYKRAYDTDQNEESGLQYLSSLRMLYPEDKYLSFLDTHPEFRTLSLLLEQRMDRALTEFEGSEENRMLNALAIAKDEGDEDGYYREIERVLRGLKEQYEKMVTI